MIEQILSKVYSYLPSYWPLQSFIATNPLYGLIEQSFDECIINLNKYTSINGTLSINYYHNAFANGEITVDSLKESITEFLLDKKITNKSSNKLLLNFLIDANNQKLLEQSNKYHLKKQSILISSHIENNDNYLENKKIYVQIGKFLSDYLDLGQAQWKMPVNTNNLYGAWIEYNLIGRSLLNNVIKEICDLNSTDAIIYLVSKLQISDDLLEKYFVEIVFKILGWCSLIKWLEEHPDNPYIKKSAQVNDVLAIWLTLEYVLSLEVGYKFNQLSKSITTDFLLEDFKEQFDEDDDLYQALNDFAIRLIWQRSLEIEYRYQLMNKIKLNHINSKNLYGDKNTCKSQFVFCIDTRSEGIRRKLEFVGNYETFGFAGFFGVGFKLYDEKTSTCVLQCPAIVNPDITLVNKSDSEELSLVKKITTSLSNVLNKVKNTFFAPLVLFDIIGGYFSFALILKTFIPNKANKLFANHQINYSNNSIDVFDKKNGFTRSVIAEKARFVLSAIGLVDNFAPFVIISGHIAQSTNNPFQSSLDCGACGGNGGIPNSIAFCQALNDTEVRDILKEKYSISIPDNTFFISACHNTTTDKFEYYNINSMNKKQIEDFVMVQNDINTACDLLRNERLATLYGDKSVDSRKSNWAELIPEMALANNAAIIIAPRSITQNIHLNRRTFLHSYEPNLDTNGEILSFILHAPVIVAHWINSQYYFSTTDEHLYGAGNKAIHNIVGGFGVMEGNFSDLKIGLPRQSIFYQDKLIHQPLRLTVVIYANKKLVLDIIAQSTTLTQLFNGRWIHLEVIEPNNLN